MKRYRVLSFDFDTRVHMLTQEISNEWDDQVKKLHRQNRKAIEKELVSFYGQEFQEAKRQNFIDLGDKPLSILAFHNRFFEQIRTAFVIGAYYPALTATCALGERILNHLILILRDDFRNTPEYKMVSRKDSFDNWDIPIDTLESWSILLPDVTKQFRRLRDLRNKAIHFRPEVDSNDRALALEAIQCLREIIRNQFSAFGSQPWFITNIPDESYIKQDWESMPFIQKVYLANCISVGPKHRIESLIPKIVVNDNFQYEESEITDEEFSEIRKKQR